MSDAIKWALLVVGAVTIIAFIICLPFMEFLNVGEFANLISGLVEICGTAFIFARGMINNFLTPFGRTALTGLMVWLFGKFAITTSIKISVWAYHFIFK